MDAHTVRAPIVGTRRGSLPALHCSCILSSTYMLCLRATAAPSCTHPRRRPPPQTWICAAQHAGSLNWEQQRAEEGYGEATRWGGLERDSSEVRALFFDPSASLPSPSQLPAATSATCELGTAINPPAFPCQVARTAGSRDTRTRVCRLARHVRTSQTRCVPLCSPSTLLLPPGSPRQNRAPAPHSSCQLVRSSRYVKPSFTPRGDLQGFRFLILY